MAQTATIKLASFPGSHEAMGDVAAEAFARFDRGMLPDEIVTELVLPVDTVEYLWRTWARLRGVVLLSPEAARMFREALYGSRPIANGSDAVAAVRRFVERPLKPCPRCRSGARQYCATCTSKEARRAARDMLRGSRKGVPRVTEATAARKDGSPVK
jgi:hypothetical protein